MKIDWFYVISNVAFFMIGFMIQEREVSKMERENAAYKRLAEAKVMEVVKAVSEAEEDDD